MAFRSLSKYSLDIYTSKKMLIKLIIGYKGSLVVEISSRYF